MDYYRKYAMKKLLIASALGLGIFLPSVHVMADGAPHDIPKSELQNAQWQLWQDRHDETRYYRVKDVGSRNGIWIKEVDKDDGDVTFKHYRADCSGSPVVKDAEIEIEHGRLDREVEHDTVNNPTKADALRSLICR